ncbi:MerR family transcriptional regulator [Terrabacter sp. BE26]|uniref:MerR family transcriptional regulator n=1 Tax=Terrabacter sp. BE26 TaxID=2898152 RepID=UPI0035BE1E47
MKISELSERTGVSIATLKYYLREGLLHPGAAEGATRARYDDSHVERVRLVRTLADVGRLPLERVREVVDALDDPPATRHELLGVAQHALRPSGISAACAEGGADTPTMRRVASLGVPGGALCAAGRQLADALDTAAAAGWVVTDAQLSTWFRALEAVARTDVAPELAHMAPGDAMRHVVLGTVLTDPILLALRRVAQVAVSAERLESVAETQPEPGLA